MYYVDDKGKERRQLYTLVDAGGKAGPPAAATAVAVQPVAASAAPRQSSPAPAPAPPAPASPAPAPSVGSVQAVPPERVEKVRCNFSSTPPGAEITLDGKYVGSTPSEIPVSTGTHVVILSMPGVCRMETGAYGRGRVSYKCDGQLAKDATVSRDRCYGTNSNFCLRFNGGMVAREVVVG